jgi:glycosyltransferase involved in cell wall biosynthesis
LASRYAFVLEPSSWGYEDPGFFMYAGADADVVVQAPWKRDFGFLEGLQSNITPVRFGAGDWVDPARFFSDKPATERRYDVAMVSAWSALKRHKDLFQVAARMKKEGRIIRMALVGYPHDWTCDTVRQLAREHGVEDQCTILDSVPQSVVAELVGESRSYVLLSRREGANRALYEALFCDTPVVVYAGHRGVDTDIIGDGVGVLFEPDTLQAAIEQILDHPEQFHAREWAQANSGFRNATASLNRVLRELSEKRGLPWTTDIAAKRNAPEIRYGDPADVDRFANEYRELSRYLR